MQVHDIMTRDPACCTPETSLRDVARTMVDEDCGALPVVENEQTRKPIGMVTDRDIVCRLVAEGRNPLESKARDAMTGEAVTVPQDASLEDCEKLMEQKQLRRIPVVDANGACCGIVAQADIALRADAREAGEVVKDVSRPSQAPSKLN